MTIGDALAKIGKVLHLDGWRNTASGLGVLGVDRAVSTDYQADVPIPPQVLSDLYHGVDLCALVVDIYPEEAMRRGVCAPPSVKDRFADLDVRGAVDKAARWGRLFGGALVVLAGPEGADMSAPLPPGTPYDVRRLYVYDRREVTREAARGGGLLSECDLFTINEQNGHRYQVHRSRCLVFGGASTATREREANAGWDLSVLQRAYPIIRDFASGYLALGHMLTDASQAVFKMRGLLAALASDRKEDLITRINLMDLTRGVARAVMLDASPDGAESFERVAMQFGGVPESVDRLANRLASCTRIPVTILMGQAPAGLNATGETDLRSWYDRVDSWRGIEILPHLDRLAKVLDPAAGPCSFPPLWVPTEGESAATAKVKIDGAIALAGLEAVTSEELSQLAALVGVTIDPNVPRGATPVPVDTPRTAQDVPTPDATLGMGETPPGPNYGADLAEAMTSAGVARCEHGCVNRCPQCGIERLRGFDLGEDGAPVWRVAWRAIG